ncbi:MAG: peroxiredoxin-like family protein [Parvularculaceae bacterium]
MAEPSIAEILEEATERCRNLDAPLADRLQAFANEVRALSSEFASVVDRMVERLRQTKVGEDAPRPGEPMPDFMLPDQNGRLSTLAEFIENGPAVISFHRGHWCPYCRINADALNRIYDDVRKLGGQLVVITPEIEKFNAELRATSGARYPVLSDMDNGYALLLKLAFYVGDEKKKLMQFAGWNIPPYNANDNWTLPVPATFIVGRDGLVKVRHIDPDYRRRMDVEDILAGVKAALP